MHSSDIYTLEAAITIATGKTVAYHSLPFVYVYKHVSGPGVES